MASTDPGFGVYVHWPFCAAKCPYCDFNSHVRHNAPDQTRFAAAYEAEIAHMAAMQPGRTVTSVFFGGGTPSLMDPATVSTILNAIQKAWPVENDAEITMEANPSSSDAERFAGYRAAGVNRMSLGVQSLNDAELKRLGRLHNAAEARAAIDLARRTFPRLSFDLIYARPDQTLHGWRAELEEAISLAADHLSLYQLTIEEGTPFFDLHRRGRLVVPDDDHAADLYALTQEVTAANGLPAYEISNHAQPGCESRHNLTYWRSGTWAGIGPGAHGRLNMNDARRATANERHPENWLTQVEQHGHGMVTNEPLGTDDAGEEMLLMGLRLAEGLDVPRYEHLANKTLDPHRIETLQNYGMINTTSDGRLYATLQGRMVLNSVIAELAA